MALIMTALRLLHIFSAVAWAGGGFFLLGVLTPTVREAGPLGGQFMQRLAATGRIGRLFGMASLFTTLSGIVLITLYIAPGGRVNASFFQTLPGMTLALGAVVGILAFLHGTFATGRATRRMSALAKEMLSRQGPPAPEQLAEAQQLSAKIGKHSAISVTLVAIALLAMAAAETMTF